MKKKNVKLSLDKMTISRLNSNQASQLNGGKADTTVTSTLLMCTPCPNDTSINTTKLGYWIKSKMFSKFFLRKEILIWCLKYKGLSKETAGEYLK